MKRETERDREREREGRGNILGSGFMCKQPCLSKDEEQVIFLKGGEGVNLLGFLFVGWVILCYVGFFLLCFLLLRWDC